MGKNKCIKYGNLYQETAYAAASSDVWPSGKDFMKFLGRLDPGILSIYQKKDTLKSDLACLRIGHTASLRLAMLEESRVNLVFHRNRIYHWEKSFSF